MAFKPQLKSLAGVDVAAGTLPEVVGVACTAVVTGVGKGAGCALDAAAGAPLAAGVAPPPPPQAARLRQKIPVAVILANGLVAVLKVIRPPGSKINGGLSTVNRQLAFVIWLTQNYG